VGFHYIDHPLGYKHVKDQVVILYIKANVVSVCLSVYRGPETQITLKTIPSNSRTQKLFRTSITHFYFFTYRIPSPESRGPKNYSGLQSHTFISLLTESQVPRAEKLFRTSITHFYFFTYWVSSPEGLKTIQDFNHTLLLLYLPSPKSWVPTNPGPKSQHPTFKLLTGVPTVKEPNSKKKLGAGWAAPRCVEPRE